MQRTSIKTKRVLYYLCGNSRMKSPREWQSHHSLGMCTVDNVRRVVTRPRVDLTKPANEVRETNAKALRKSRGAQEVLTFFTDINSMAT